MTVTELRIFLEKMEKEGKGECEICVVGSLNCDPLVFVNKNIEPYYDDWNNTVTITDSPMTY